MQQGATTSVQPIQCVAWDFDKTLVLKHLHNDLYKTIKDGLCTRENYLEYFERNVLKKDIFADIKKLAHTIIGLHDKEIHQAVVSFTNFPDIIRPTLRFVLRHYMYDVVGLNPSALMQTRAGDEDEDLDAETRTGVDKLVEGIVRRIRIVAGFPTQSGQPKIWPPQAEQTLEVGKAQHLELVKKHFGIEENGSITLVDDSQPNIRTAGFAGYRTILVDTRNPRMHLERLQSRFSLSELPNRAAVEEVADEEMKSIGLQGAGMYEALQAAGAEFTEPDEEKPIHPTTHRSLVKSR